MTNYNLAVIGGGSAGMNLIRAAAARGWRCALIEADNLGGTCINVGCIPSKTLIHSARIFYQAKEARQFGVLIEPPKADWPAMVRRKDKLVGRIRSRSYTSVQENENIDLYEAEASFEGPHKLKVGDRQIEADKIVIAAGSRPAIPIIKGLEQVNYLTSTSVMEMQKLPQSMLIIGGGIIALEFSQLFARLGVKVTILQRNQRLAPILDPQFSEEISSILTEEGVEVKTGLKISEVGIQKDLLYVMDLSQGLPARFSAEKLLIAAGRASNVDRLNLHAAGVEVDDSGYIKVDKSFKTSSDQIWAIGDITGGAMYTHRAWHDGILLARHLLDDETISNQDRLIPYAIFTDPEIAGVGLSEREAREAGYAVTVKQFKPGYKGRALAMGQLKGQVKLIADKQSGKLLGAFIMAYGAGELLHELILGIRLGVTIDVLRDMMHIHPTLSEAISSASWAD